VITSLNWTLIFVGCVFRLKSKNNPRKNTCVIEFGLRLQILLTIGYSKVNMTGMNYVTH
jgi:hypothetical protein